MSGKWILILSVFWAFLGAPAFAENLTDEECLRLYSLSELIMKSRQNGVPMPDVVKIFDGIETMRALVIVAYDEPRYGTDEMQARTIQEFADSVYARCLKQ